MRLVELVTCAECGFTSENLSLVLCECGAVLGEIVAEVS